MKNITDNFGSMYTPVKALVVFQKNDAQGSTYVESYDMDANGYPINAHQLSLSESSALANALDTSDELRRNFLKSSGLLPKNMLYINPDHDGYAIWYTPAMEVPLFFVEKLGIPNGTAAIPSLLWKASKKDLYIFALDGVEEIEEQTPLYRAPFSIYTMMAGYAWGRYQLMYSPTASYRNSCSFGKAIFSTATSATWLVGKAPYRETLYNYGRV